MTFLKNCLCWGPREWGRRLLAEGDRLEDVLDGTTNQMVGDGPGLEDSLMSDR
jgi:hypothetical protein